MAEVVFELVEQKAGVRPAWEEYKAGDALAVHAPSVGQGLPEEWNTLQ
jgi:hypothetical protein